VATPYDTTLNLAAQVNGAAPSVARNNIAGYAAIHQPHFANDGHYGNGASWIAASTWSWVKIDMGQPQTFNRVSFGRDRWGAYNDRDPGQFTIQVADSDDVYANGDDLNDGTEYTTIFESSSAGFSGNIHWTETWQSRFATVTARYIKIIVERNGTCIDEVEVQNVATDTDGDGVDDADDECPDSELSPTIVVNGDDTGVENELVGDGCSLADLIAELLAEDPSTANVVQFLVELKAQGIISGQEMGQIIKGMTP
jgi:hypothetical protein